jgi:hypothetical protein
MGLAGAVPVRPACRRHLAASEGDLSLQKRGESPLTDQQLERLKASIGRIRRTPEFQTVRQFVVAEGSEEHPDYSGLRRLILETFAKGLDLEIDAVREKRKRETA